MIVFRQYSDDETLAKRHLTDRVDVNRYVVVCEADLYILMLDVSQLVSFTSAKR